MRGAHSHRGIVWVSDWPDLIVAHNCRVHQWRCGAQSVVFVRFLFQVWCLPPGSDRHLQVFQNVLRLRVPDFPSPFQPLRHVS